MKVENFVNVINAEFYTGVPDSQLKALCDYLYKTYKINGKHHIVAANEGNAVGIAAGYHLATGKVPVVYMQNSGEGNVINPLASLLNEKVYAIPCIFIIGWRGEPGVYDEPQHIFQGEITLKLLDLMGVQYILVSPDTKESELEREMAKYKKLLSEGHSVAFVIRKGALYYEEKVDYSNDYNLLREDAIKAIVNAAGDDLIVSTTGKAGRELFEIRKANGQNHSHDFLTVGSMGHASSIALGIALNTDKRVWCIDGDGAMLMHMGALATIGRLKPENLIHMVINNGAHETVGGMPTTGCIIDFTDISRNYGYSKSVCVESLASLEKELKILKKTKRLSFVEVKCALGSRNDLGRPTSTPIENKESLMKNLF